MNLLYIITAYLSLINNAYINLLIFHKQSVDVLVVVVSSKVNVDRLKSRISQSVPCKLTSAYQIVDVTGGLGMGFDINPSAGGYMKRNNSLGTRKIFSHGRMKTIICYATSFLLRARFL